MTQDKQKLKSVVWDITILFFSIYVLIALFIERTFSVSSEVSTILHILDSFICIIFLSDFAVNLARAENRLKYFFTWGWIDLLSSLPQLEIFRWGRFARVFRIIRILRAVRSFRTLVSFFFSNKAKGTFASVTMVAFVVMLFGSIMILDLEAGVKGANITNAEEALWWSFVTITTAGFGDYYPVTTEGRLVATVLMITGIGIFSTFTAFIATFFLGNSENEQADKKSLEAKLEELSLQIEKLESLVKKSDSN